MQSAVDAKLPKVKVEGVTLEIVTRFGTSLGVSQALFFRAVVFRLGLC